MKMGEEVGRENWMADLGILNAVAEALNRSPDVQQALSQTRYHESIPLYFGARRSELWMWPGHPGGSSRRMNSDYFPRLDASHACYAGRPMTPRPGCCRPSVGDGTRPVTSGCGGPVKVGCHSRG